MRMTERHASACRIGFLHTGGADWIAGTIVLQNLVASLSMLPAEEQPSACLMVGPGQRIDDHDRSTWMPRLEPYAFRSGTSWASKIRTTIRHHRRLRWPASLEGLSRRLHLSALYPLHVSLGPRFPRPWIGWIPDFQHKHLPQYFPEHDSLNRDRTFTQLVQEAPHVTVSSQDAYRDLMRWVPADRNKISVLSFTTVARPEWYADDPVSAGREFALPPKYLMFPSQFWLHKNHRCVFRALRIAERVCPDIALVCTGRLHDYRRPGYADELMAETRREGLGQRIRVLGLVDRHTQVQLMRRAAAIIQPSFFEGWSALVEDARTLGKRIYVSDIPVHREQAPANAVFFDPHSPEQLAGLIAEDWPHLAPGPDPAAERDAFAAQRLRALAYARRFLSIVRLASGTC